MVGPLEAITLCQQIEENGVDHQLAGFITPHDVFLAIGLGAADSCAVFWESADSPYVPRHGTMSADGPLVTHWYG